MYSDKLRLIIMVIMIVIIIIALVGCTDQVSDAYTPAQMGVMDLSESGSANDIVHLDGDWELYWNQLIDPDEIEKGEITGYIHVPGSWNKHLQDISEKPGKGYATYRLTFVMGEDAKLALRIPRLHTSYKLWVNGELAAKAGEVGKSLSTTKPQYLPQRAFFDVHKGNNEIIIQVSNFYHRSGGILESIKLGGVEEILRSRYISIVNSVLVFGCLIIMGIYHITLFLNRKKDTYTLYFGLGCIAFGTRALMYGENIFIYLFPLFSWEIAHKIVTLSYYLGVPILVMFFHSAFPAYFHDFVIKIIGIVGIAFGILVIFTPARIFTVVNPVYQIWSVLVILYAIVNLIRITVNKEKDGWILMLGSVAFFGGSISEIVFHNIWMKDATIISTSPILRAILISDNLSSTGLLIFAVANSLLLARRFTDSLNHEERLTVELAEINTNLDKIVSQRTNELVVSKEKIEQQKLELEEKNQQLQALSLKDSLTGLWNRRKYDEAINTEWYRGLRYQKPVALIFIDIDYYKRYNDEYGHLKGDEALKEVAQCVQNFFSRSTDIVARYGGEEFIVILSEIEKENAIRIADNLRREIEGLKIPHADSPIGNYITVSIGVTSMIPDRDSSYEDLFTVVDKALYLAKNSGRNQIVFLPQ